MTERQSKWKWEGGLLFLRLRSSKIYTVFCIIIYFLKKLEIITKKQEVVAFLQNWIFWYLLSYPNKTWVPLWVGGLSPRDITINAIIKHSLKVRWRTGLWNNFIWPSTELAKFQFSKFQFSSLCRSLGKSYRFQNFSYMRAKSQIRVPSLFYFGSNTLVEPEHTWFVIANSYC